MNDQNSRKRIGVFVDITRQYRTVKAVDQSFRIDYKKYLERAVDGQELHRAYAYGIQLENEANNFMLALHAIGYEVKYKQAVNISGEENGPPKYRFPNRDVDLAIDVIRELPYIDVIVLGTNHSEIVPLVKYVKEQGKKVFVYSYGIHKELRMAASRCMELDEDMLNYVKNDEHSEAT